MKKTSGKHDKKQVPFGLYKSVIISQKCVVINNGHCFEWADIKQDLKALQEITIEDKGKTLAIRSEYLGTCGKIFQAIGVAIPPTIREVT